MHLLKEHVPSRYQFHDLLRVYATEQAAKKEFDHQRQLAIRRVLDYYLHTSIAANQLLNPHRVPIAVETVQPGVIPNQVTSHEEASEWFTTEHDVLLAATNLAARSGLYAHAWQLPWALSTFLHRWGHWHDYAATQHTALVAAADHLGDRAAQALALRLLGHAYTHLERYAIALTCLRQALIQYQDLGDRDGQARTHLSLGMACERQNQYAEALAHAEQAFNLYRITGNRIWQARALNNVGWYHALLGLYQETLIHCQQALTLHHELGDRMGVANTLDSLGYAEYHLGRHDHALTCYQQSVASWQEIGHHYHEARSLSRLGDTHHASGNYSAARNTCHQALAILDRLGHPDAKHLRTKLAKFQTNLNCWR
jgi:tetratricopeptide (TPR) repeat protein